MQKESLPFVKFVDGKLKLVAELQGCFKNARVLSILGKARYGKSTFLNTIITRLTGQNSIIFKTHNFMEHCTRGIDYYYIPSHNLLLLDSQGLDSQDSSHEPSLLLFVYLISDLIIFNDSRMLQNGVLKLMEPICTFMTYVDLDEITKPKLSFRIADASTLSGTPEENIKMIIDTVYEDQYQSIRESIRHLFHPDIQLVKTDTIDKKSQKMLEDNDYIRLILEGDCGFQDAIDTLLISLPDLDRGPVNYIVKIPTIIEQINNNEKIKIEKLDIVGMTVRDEIRSWISSLDMSIFSPIEVDGTQGCYVNKVEPRKAIKKSTLTAFTKRFKSVPDKIREPEKMKLAMQLASPITKAEEDSTVKAEQRISSFVKIAQADRIFPTMNSYQRSFNSWTKAHFDSYLDVFIKLEKAIEDIYTPVNQKYKEWCEEQFQRFFTAVREVTTLEQEQKKKLESIFSDSLIQFSTTSQEKIPTLEIFNSRNIVVVKDTEILMNWSQNHIQETKAKLPSIIKYYTLEVKMVEKRIETTLAKVTTPISPDTLVNYDLIKDMYIGFVKDMGSLYVEEQAELVSQLIERKKELLYNKFLRPGEYANTVIMINPTIEFVIHGYFLGNNVIDGACPYMTKDTYNDVYMPLINQVKDKMIKKGYCKEKDQPYSFTMSSVPNQSNVIQYLALQTTKFQKNLNEIFIEKLKKIYCKEITGGTVFPSDFV